VGGERYAVQSLMFGGRAREGRENSFMGGRGDMTLPQETVFLGATVWSHAPR